MEHQLARLTLSWQDASGSVGLTHLWCKPGLTIAQIVAGADVLRPLLHALSGAALTGQQISIRGAEIPRPVAAGPELAGDAGMFIFDCAGGGYFYVSIPSLKSDLLMPSGCGAGVRIALDSPRVASLSGALQILFCDPFGAAILPVRAGQLQQLWRGR